MTGNRRHGLGMGVAMTLTSLGSLLAAAAQSGDDARVAIAQVVFGGVTALLAVYFFVSAYRAPRA